MDGRDGVIIYKQEGPFESVALQSLLLVLPSLRIYSVVLLDLSMPVLDGSWNLSFDHSCLTGLHRGCRYSGDPANRVG